MTGQQLKNSILQWAIQGKLVPQIASEGTADDLLKEIRAEKERLVKEGKLKKKDLEVKPIEEDEVPFDIPEGWRWCRLGELVFNRDSERIPLSVAVRSIQKNKQYDYYGPGGAFDKVDDYIFDKRLLLIGEDGANLLTQSKPNAFFAEGKYWVNNHVHVLDNYVKEDVLLDFISLRVNGMSLADYVTGTAQPKMNQEKMNSIQIPLPPLSEQKRIVSKIEELMPLVEQYGKAQEQLEALNKELPETLKKSVLQEAIMGKLVPQDPNEGTAEELLAEIRKEKEKLVKEGKLKKKDLEVKPIEEDEVPFEIPKGWRWCRLGELVFNRDSERIPLSVAVRSIQKNKQYDYYGPGGAFDKVDDYIFDKRLLLIGEDGANLLTQSKPNAFFAEGKYWVNNHVHVLDNYIKEDVLLDFISLRVNGMSLADYVTGTAQPKMNQEKMNSIQIPLPPLAEQKRIVAKIEEVMGEIEGMK